ncbi:MAG TPA: gliding motility-associated C-terminal domain-containing protein, partial [Bacteroidia bacterium]|nr:gliding motility-associated C-terminal domain-containing protein [Bacteroidia bacterium]
YYPLMDHRVTEYSVKIYNRWGEKMYETENSGMWDGKFKNDDVPPGVYFVILRYKDCRSEEPFELNGTVTLFREK